ncbi:MAG: hypothetical protein AAGC85_06210, partial [Bacteroidota bacterium]
GPPIHFAGEKGLVMFWVMLFWLLIVRYHIKNRLPEADQGVKTGSEEPGNWSVDNYKIYSV